MMAPDLVDFHAYNATEGRQLYADHVARHSDVVQLLHIVLQARTSHPIFVMHENRVVTSLLATKDCECTVQFWLTLSEEERHERLNDLEHAWLRSPAWMPLGQCSAAYELF